MKISSKSVVAFHYTLFNETGDEVESSRGSEPSLCLIGAGNILPGLEQAIMTKQAGDKVDVTLEPRLAYGVFQADKKDRISAKYLKHEGKLHAGKVVSINTKQGAQTATVVKVGKFSVDIDLNHPLAGQTVTFAIEIDDLRAATQEEISHGHAHGAGGHQH